MEATDERPGADLGAASSGSAADEAEHSSNKSKIHADRGNELTILRTFGPLATKRVTLAGTESYGHAKTFSVKVKAVDDINNLFLFLQDMDDRSKEFIIRAEPLPDINPAKTRRLLHQDKVTGEGPYFRDVPRSWCAFDFDSVPAPVALDSLNPHDSGAYLRDLLPEPFWNANCVVHATSSCGIKDGLRYRLWFWLDRALTGAELQAWCHGCQIDPSTLRSIEPIYVAAPIFVDVPDPVSKRWTLLAGLGDAVEVPQFLPEPPDRRNRDGDGSDSSVGVGGGFDAWLDRIGDGEGGQGFRQPMVSALAAYAARYGHEALARNRSELRSKVAAAFAAAPRKPGRAQSDLDRHLSDAHFEDLVQWIVAQEKVKPGFDPWPDPNAAADPDVAAPKPASAAEQRDELRAFHRAVAEMNATYSVVNTGGRTLITQLIVDRALDRERLVFVKQADFVLRFRHRTVLTGWSVSTGKPIIKDVGNAWIEAPRRRNYADMALIANGVVPPDTLNLWRGFGVVPKPGEWQLIYQHLHDVVCAGDASHLDYLLGWFARAVQQPDRPGEVAIVMRGKKGTGKGIAAQILMKIFRHYGLQITHSETLNVR